MTKTKEQIKDEAATDWCIEKGVYNKEHFAFQAGFDFRDKLDNEALKIAVEALEFYEKMGDDYNTSLDECLELAFLMRDKDKETINLGGKYVAKVAKESLAEIKKIVGEGCAWMNKDKVSWAKAFETLFQVIGLVAIVYLIVSCQQGNLLWVKP